MSHIEIQFESSNLAPTARLFLTTRQAQAKSLTQLAEAERFIIEQVRDAFAKHGAIDEIERGVALNVHRPVWAIGKLSSAPEYTSQGGLRATVLEGVTMHAPGALQRAESGATRQVALHLDDGRAGQFLVEVRLLTLLNER